MMITVNEVHLPVVEDNYGLAPSGRKLRAFQKEFVDSIHRRNADVIQLVAPTGAGKTLCFEYLIKQGHKVLLLYPTNALIQSQLERFKRDGFTAVNISSKILTKKGYERAQELKGWINRYDVLLSNPDIFQAIIGHMYRNPEDDLIQSFLLFDYVIYDEFHAYREFELSGVLTQIALFQNMSQCKIILSSATPKSEILELLNYVKIGKERRGLVVEDIIAKSCKPEESSEIIKYETTVHFNQGKILDHIEKIIAIVKNEVKNLEVGAPRILFIFDSVKDCNLFYNLLFKDYPEIYIITEKDNGYDTNQVGDTADFTKPILISTNKSEVGLDYPIRLLFMEDGFNFDSFIQRFGRVSRRDLGICYIFTKQEAEPLFLQDQYISYEEFLHKLEYITEKYNVNKNKVLRLFTFRQAIAIQEYHNRREDLCGYFVAPNSGYSYKLWFKFFSIIKKNNEGNLRNRNLDRLNLLIEDFKQSCRSLRGRSLPTPVIYQRGHEIRQTMYDILTVLNRVPSVVENTENGLMIREINSKESGPFIKAIKVPYLPGLLNYQMIEEQFKTGLEILADKALVTFDESQREFLLACIHSLYYCIDVDRFIIPEEIILWNDKIVSLSRKTMGFK